MVENTNNINKISSLNNNNINMMSNPLTSYIESKDN